MEAKASELPASSPLLSIFSHPLYLSYFIFFFPYMVNLFSFLFPLLVAVSLLLLALYTLSPPLRQDYCDVSLFSDSKLGVFSAFQPFFEDFDAYRTENGEIPDGFGDEKGEERAEFPPLTEKLRENRAPDSTQISESKKNEEEEEEEEEEKELRLTENPSESEEKANSCRSSSRTKSMEDSQALALNIDGSPGSTRKQREWRRTLAFKLHEERRSVEENSERMDLLWETYEKEAERNRSRSSRKSKNGGLEKKEKETESDEEEEEDSNGDLCCLQAFKISAGKMNLGMGKGKLVKFSKALRGIGWFSQVKVKPKHLTKRNSNYFC